MPPAKADGYAWQETCQQTGNFTDLIVREACNLCRQAKVRCLRQGREPCLRCVRLGGQCIVQPHRKGPQRGHKRKKVKVANGQDQGLAVTTGEGGVEARGPSVSSSPASRNDIRSLAALSTAASLHMSNTSQDYSTSSLFQLGEDDAQIKLRQTTLAGQLASGTAHDKAKAAERREAPSGEHLYGPDVLLEGPYTEVEVREHVQFFFARLNACIALLTPSLNSWENLSCRKESRFLLAAICAVSARFLRPRKCQEAYAFAQRYVDRFHQGALPAQLEHCQAFSILSMWRLPTDPTGWRKLHAAITMSFELDMPKLTRELVNSDQCDAEILEKAQVQRTMFQIACCEEHFRVQRQIPALLAFDCIPDPRAWIESLGNHCLDIDVRIAAAIDQITIFRRLQGTLNTQVTGASKWSDAMSDVRAIRAARADQSYTASIWLNAAKYGIAGAFAGAPCGVFNMINHDFNYCQSLLAIYNRPEVKGRVPTEEVSTTFKEACDQVCALLELLNGEMGRAGYYRFVHDNVICSIATGSLWIVDNFTLMDTEHAKRAYDALQTAFVVTQDSQDRANEQSSYLFVLLRYCCQKLNSQTDQVSHSQVMPFNANEAELAALDWFMSLSSNNATLFDSLTF